MSKRLALALTLLVWLSQHALAATVTDSRGPQEIETPPTRVISLDWSVTEQLLALDVVPLAVTDASGYRVWVNRPELPASVDDVGIRREPNIERIVELKPDLIVISDDQLSLAKTLEEIAPVLHFDSFNAEHDNAAEARRIYLELSKAFGKEELARDRLAKIDAQLATLKSQLKAHFGGTLPKVTSIRLLDTAHVRIYGGNSMAEAALSALGIEPALPQPRTEWGFALKRVDELGAAKDGVILEIEPFDFADKLFSTPIWQAMPFVKAGKFGTVRSSWTYGGAASIGILAESFTEALLKLNP